MGQIVVVERRKGSELILHYRFKMRGVTQTVAELTSITVNGRRVRRDREPRLFRELVSRYGVDETIIVRVGETHRTG